MHHLAVTQVKAVLDFVWRVRRTADLPGFVSVVLQGLKTLVSCELGGAVCRHAGQVVSGRRKITAPLTASRAPPWLIRIVCE